MISLICSLLSSALFGFSMRSATGEIIINNAPMGTIYSLETYQHQSYRLQNTSDKPIDVTLEISVPSTKDSLAGGYRPWPDANLIGITKNHARLAPTEEIRADILFKLPQDSKYLGKKFQAYVWAKSVPVGGNVAVAAGLKSRLLINVGRTPAQEVGQIVMKPEFLKVTNIPQEKSVKLGKNYQTFSLVNTSTKTISVELTALPASASPLRPSDICSEGDLNWINIPSKTYRIGPQKNLEIPIKIKIPLNAPRDNYCFTVKSAALGFDQPVVSLGYLRLNTD